jgi:hypothetical protein
MAWLCYRYHGLIEFKVLECSGIEPVVGLLTAAGSDSWVEWLPAASKAVDYRLLTGRVKQRSAREELSEQKRVYDVVQETEEPVWSFLFPNTGKNAPPHRRRIHTQISIHICNSTSIYLSLCGLRNRMSFLALNLRSCQPN